MKVGYIYSRPEKKTRRSSTATLGNRVQVRMSLRGSPSTAPKVSPNGPAYEVFSGVVYTIRVVKVKKNT